MNFLKSEVLTGQESHLLECLRGRGREVGGRRGAKFGSEGGLTNQRP